MCVRLYSIIKVVRLAQMNLQVRLAALAAFPNRIRIRMLVIREFLLVVFVLFPQSFWLMLHDAIYNFNAAM